MCSFNEEQSRLTTTMRNSGLRSIPMLLLIGMNYIPSAQGSECIPYDHSNPFTVNVTSDVKNISSPNYPNPYGESLSCYWKLDLPQEQTLHLYLKEFDVVCSNDNLVIYNGVTFVESRGNLYEGCWNNATETFMNASRSTGLRFDTDNSGNGRGFLLLYSSNAETLQTHVANIDNGSGGGSGSGNTNSTGSTNGTLGTDNSGATRLNNDSGVVSLWLFIGALLLIILYNSE